MGKIASLELVLGQLGGIYDRVKQKKTACTENRLRGGIITSILTRIYRDGHHTPAYPYSLYNIQM